MVECLRTKVSGTRRRYIDDEFNLDLTYIIPDRIVAMSYPSQDYSTLWRNPIEKVRLHNDPNVFNFSFVVRFLTSLPKSMARSII